LGQAASTGRGGPPCASRFPREQRVAAFDLLERLEHGVGFGLVAVRDAPLDFADPDAHAREFGGVFVELYAQHVVRAGDQVLLARKAQVGGLRDAHQLYVLERLEPEEQKVAAAAGRVQDAKVGQRLQPLHEARVRLLVGGVAMLLDFGREPLQILRKLLPLL